MKVRKIYGYHSGRYKDSFSVDIRNTRRHILEDVILKINGSYYSVGQFLSEKFEKKKSLLLYPKILSALCCNIKRTEMLKCVRAEFYCAGCNECMS
jgi:hypothetical protein